MSEPWVVIIILATCTFGIRLSGILIGQRLPVSGAWSRGLNALPGCLIIALVANLILSGSVNEWIASAVAVSVALATRSLPLTMGAGIVVVFVLRHQL